MTAPATMPERVAKLPRDRRGYPIPWNVLTAHDGTPFFTVNDDRKARRALVEELCPICGEKLGRWRWFVGGPRSAFDPHGWYADLPGHYECMRFALVTCPYLAAPKYLGRVDVIQAEKLPPEARVLLDQTIIPDRPSVFVMVAGERIELSEHGSLPPHVRPTRPFIGVEYWRTGKQLSEADALPWLRTALGEDWNPPRIAGR